MVTNEKRAAAVVAVAAAHTRERAKKKAKIRQTTLGTKDF